MIADDYEFDMDNDELVEDTQDWATIPQSQPVNFALVTGTQGNTEARVIQAYLGSTCRTNVSRQHDPLYAGIHCVALASFLKHTGCRIEGAVNIREHPHPQVVNLDLTMVETAPGRRESAPEEGLVFIHRPSGKRLVLKLDPHPFGPYSGSCFTAIDAAGTGGEFLDSWEKYATVNAYLRGKAFYATGELVSIDPHICPSDVLMEPDARRLVDKLILSFPEQVRRFRSHGLSAKRGIILEGPPGTGKTMLCRALCNHLNCTFIWLTSRHMSDDAGKIAQAWKMARLLSPAVILLEDLDLIAESRDSNFQRYLLGELMNQMDGVVDNDGILTIATTNQLETIEKAIRNRPGRFDHSIHMGALDEASRRKLLDRYLRNADLEDGVLERLLESTPGYTGACLVNLIKSMVISATMHSDNEGRSRLQMTLDLLETVLQEQRPADERRPVGFHTEQL